jgi:hypothetical protein
VHTARERRLPAFLAVLTLLVFASTRVDALPPANEKWVRVRTENFVIVSNAKPKLARKIGIELERFRDALESDASSPPSRTTIVVFKNEESFAPYKLDRDGRPRNIAGEFCAARFANYIGMNADAGQEPYATTYHEYTHYLMRNQIVRAFVAQRRSGGVLRHVPCGRRTRASGLADREPCFSLEVRGAHSARAALRDQY